MFCLKGRRRIELPEIALLVRIVIVICLFSVPISLYRRFSIATSYLLNRSVFSISLSDVDSDFSQRHEDIEAVEENDGWCYRWVFCDYKLFISKLFYFVVSYIYFSRVKA